MEFGRHIEGYGWVWLGVGSPGWAEEREWFSTSGLTLGCTRGEQALIMPQHPGLF